MKLIVLNGGNIYCRECYEESYDGTWEGDGSMHVDRILEDGACHYCEVAIVAGVMVDAEPQATYDAGTPLEGVIRPMIEEQKQIDKPKPDTFHNLIREGVRAIKTGDGEWILTAKEREDVEKVND